MIGINRSKIHYSGLDIICHSKAYSGFYNTCIGITKKKFFCRIVITGTNKYEPYVFGKNSFRKNQ